MRQEIIDLYDQFTHSAIDRRVFMTRLSELAGGTAAATALIPLLMADKAKAAMVPETDARLRSERVAFPTDAGELMGYFAQPAEGAAKRGGVLVVHENRGLNPHTEDVARRVALAGFNALAVDLLSPLGGTPANEDQAREMIGKLDQAKLTADAKAALAWLRARPDSNGKVGIVGFCWGGGVAGRVAVAAPDLDAGVVFYGQPPPADVVSEIEAPLLLNYAGLDERLNAGVPAFEAALKAAGVDYTVHIYEGANHAFLNDTSAARYDEKAAKLAWERTIAFFQKNLA
jgi:carboxymethylenebutenolidase